MQQQNNFKYIKTIHLQNLITKKLTRFSISKQWQKLKILNWHEIIQIIQLYQPNYNLNKILIQIKINGIWQYVTHSFSTSLQYGQDQYLQIRYKIYDQFKVIQADSQQINKKLQICQAKFRQYQQKFDISNIDINIFWASPVQERGSHSISFKIWCQGYIRGIYDILIKSKKRSYLSTNLFNYNCLKNRNQYSIVYLLCHTVTYQNPNGKIKSKFLIGENNNGQKIEISPEDTWKIFRNKKIQLLILHTSYPYYHLQQIQKCQGIRNILIIKSTPIYSNDCTKFFLQRFIYYLLMNYSIKDSHFQSMIQTHKKFPNEQTCCCYHKHHETQCQSNQPNLKLSVKRFATYHYNKHKRQKKPNQCCCPQSKTQQYDHNVKHSLNLKYQFTKNSQKYYNKKFQFQAGDVQGDIMYKKGFETRQSLLGNRNLLLELLTIFKKPDNLKKSQNYFKIFNIYNKMCGEKKIFVQHLANFLIRRKIFIINKMFQLKDIEYINMQKNPYILYTIFCQNTTMQVLKKLQSYCINILLVSQQNLQIKKLDNSYGLKNIQPLNQNQCMNYIKAQKHLTKQLKQKVQIFFQFTYHKLYSFVYYPINFDYNQIMSTIAQTCYEKNSNGQFIKWMYLLDNHNLLEEYVIFITIFNGLPENLRKQLAYTVTKFNFYKSISNFINNPIEFINQCIKHYNLLFQKFFLSLQKISLNIVITFVKLTYSQLKQGISLYEATTDSSISLISKYFKAYIQKSIQWRIHYKLQQLCKKIDVMYILQAGLKLIKKIICSFYLYDVLQDNQQLKLQSRKSQKQQSLQKNGRDRKHMELRRIVTNTNISKIQQIKQRYISVQQEIKQKQFSIEVVRRQQQTLATQQKKQAQFRITQQKQTNIQQTKPKQSAQQQKQNSKKDRKSEMLIYSLILINNCIRFRKNNKISLQIDNQQQMQSYLQQNLTKFMKLSSIEGSTQYRNNNEIDYQEDKNSQNQQQDIKTYEQKDFIRNHNTISIKYLLTILQKIINKKPNIKILTISHSLTLQLLLQTYYKNQLQQQNIFPDAIRYQYQSLIAIIKKLDDNQNIGKYRIVYDLLMGLLVIYTHGGRYKISQHRLSNIQKQLQEILQDKQQQQYTQNPQYQKYQLFQILKTICQSQPIYNRLKYYICITNKRKKIKQQHYMDNYYNILLRWQEYNQSLTNIKSKYNINKSYIKIFNFKQVCQNQLYEVQENKNIGVYYYSLLLNLNNLLQQQLIYFSKYLMILFVINQKQSKCTINYQKLLNKTINHDYNQYDQQQQCHYNIITIKLQFNQKNLQILSKFKGCKYMIICVDAILDFMYHIKIDKKKQKYIIQKQICRNISNILSKIGNQYIFFCSPSELQLIDQVKKICINRNIIKYTYKNILNKPDNALKRVYMILISMAIANRIEITRNLHKAIHSVCTNLSIQYGLTDHKQIIRVLKPTQIRNIIITHPPISSHKQQQQQQQYYYQQGYKYDINCKQIIKQQSLKQIKNLLKIQPLKLYNKSLLPIQKNIDCKLKVFIQNLQFYMKIYENIYNFFIFYNEDVDHHSSKDNKDIKQNNKLLQQILSQKLLRVYRSQDKMIVMIINFNSNRKLSWLNDIIQQILFQSQQFKLENRYVNIGETKEDKKSCLISIRRQKNKQNMG